jgi:hypothetical protein
MDWIRDHEAALRTAEEERQRPPTLGELLDAYETDCRERGTRWVGHEASRAKWLQETLGRETPYADLSTPT